MWMRAWGLPIILYAELQMPLVSVPGPEPGGCGGGGTLGRFRGLGTGRGRGKEPVGYGEKMGVPAPSG